MLAELNEENGATKVIEAVTNNCLNEFDGHLYGLEMGIAYGGGIAKIAQRWKGRGELWGFDTFEGHPVEQMLERCEASRNSGGLKSHAAICMDLWYQENNRGFETGIDKVKYDYIRQELDKQGLDNVQLVKGLVTDKTDVSFVPYLHYALLDMDFPQAQKDGYELIKHKFVKGGYLCLHDMVPRNHIPGCWEVYQEILNEGLFELVTEEPWCYLVVLRKK